MVEIREVKTKKEQKEFLNFPLKMYKGNKWFVPPLYGDEKAIFKKDYVYYDQSEAKYWNAYKDGKMVGRISAILQKAANEKWNQKRVRFTRFDAIDDQEVATELFKVVEAYAKEKGMNEVVGPLGFSDQEREGLLIEGFDQLNTFEEQYNFPYYQKLIENCGYGKDVDWLEHRIFPTAEAAEKIIKMSDKILAKGDIKLVPYMSFKKFAKRYADQLFEILDKTYDNIYGTVPFTQGMKDMLVNNYGMVINMHYFPVVVDKNDKIIAFGLSFPGFGSIFQKSNGHLTPSTIVRLLKEVKHPTTIDLGLVGVLPEGALKGAQVVTYGETIKWMIKDKIKYAETNLNLENNDAIINTWRHFETVQHKRRRCFIKNI